MDDSVTSEASPERTILTPSSLNQMVRDLLEDALPSIWIEGELSNVSRPASGHLYFTLKDARAQVRCAMFKPRSGWLPFKPADGLQVLARARVGLYEARGEFQLVVEHLEQSGEGALRRQFEALKARLAAEGLFDSERKRALPAMPRRIGVITSPTGAAVRDVLNVLARRFPLVEIEILPVPVQGREAPAAIVAMLDAAGRANRHDVLLLTRGGGSLEDLWAFNDESVARAIARCTIPLVAAIGHEIDFSIADFVADMRAPTPSAAAELLVPDIQELQRALATRRQRLVSHVRRRLESNNQRSDHLLSRLNLQRPTLRLQRSRERMQALSARMIQISRRDLERRRARLDQLRARLSAHDPKRRLLGYRERSQVLATRLHGATRRLLERRRSRLDEVARALHAVSPLATLARGYSILVERQSGRIVTHSDQVAAGSALRAILASGELRVRVEGDD